MYKRYQIETKEAPPEFEVISKFNIVRDDLCINCGRCLKACIYGVHNRLEVDPRIMDDPTDILCKNCFRCIEECPRGALSMLINPDYENLGDGYVTPGMIATIWGEAETGRIPVLGAGYKGPFTGFGFDGMWTDMSEIVRPTRDGIHGREYISSSVDLGRKPPYLKFDDDGSLLNPPPIITIPIPILFDTNPLIGKNARDAAIRAAEMLGTYSIISVPERNNEDVQSGKIMIEYAYQRGGKIRELDPDNPVLVRVPFSREVEYVVEDLTNKGVGIIHLCADHYGREFEKEDPRYIKDLIRLVHQHLVDVGIRDEVTLIAGGGIVAAEHVPKVIICGADAVSLSQTLLLALGCKGCIKCSSPCPVGIENVNIEWAAQRIVNLMGAWCDQLIEVLGAMGIREVRRLRGETGRAIFFEEMEEEIFRRSEIDA